MQAVPVRARRSALAALALMLSLLCVQQDASALDLGRFWPVVGAGPVVTELQTVGPFRALTLDTAARVIVRQGNRHAVEVHAEGNVAPLIETTVDDGTLIVRDSRRYTSSAAEVIVTARRIGSIATNGSVAVLAEGLNSPSLSLSLGGSSAVTLTSASIGKLHAGLGGSSVLKVSGTAEDFSCALGGSSAVEASGLAANAVSISGGGSAQAVVWARESLSLSLGGSSDVRYYGKVTPSVSTAGSATVRSLGDTPAKQP